MPSTQTTDEQFMAIALDACRRGVEAGQTPFGACIVRDNQAVVATHNRVWLDTDITAHAEVCCLRDACKTLNTIDLSGCTVYSTTEPCPMCFSAIHWARVGRVVYGTSIADAAAFGFNELRVSNEKLKSLGSLSTEIVGGVMQQESVALFERWRARGDHHAY